MLRLSVVSFAAGLCLAGPVLAHDGEDHGAAGADPAWRPPAAAVPPAAFGLDVGGPFELVDHEGRAFTDADLKGGFSLVFFGYARCEGICPLGLRRMTEAVELLGPEGAGVRPVLITVDPQETPRMMAELAAELHPRLVGLTGTAEQLKAAAKAYKVDSSRVGTAMDGTPVFQHGSYIYLMDPAGKLLSVLPPVLPADAMAEVLRRHLNAAPGAEG